jgi:electron transfer flavoprotein beta subunit
MKTIVCVKQVGLLGDEVELTGDGTAVRSDFLEAALNEWDTYAVEAALELRDAVGGEVVAVTAGNEETVHVLRRCLAMGVDRAARVDARLGSDALEAAALLAPFVLSESPDLVICGARSADFATSATPSALAAHLNLPCVAVACRLELDGRQATVHRELEGGLIDVVSLELPAVVSVQTGINEPRFATLLKIRQAEGQEIEVYEAPVVSATTHVHALRAPRHLSSMEALGSNPGEVARQIAAIVNERAVS